MAWSLGASIIGFLAGLGNLTLFTGQVFVRLFQGRINVRNTLDQMVQLGIESLPITLVTATFVGMVFAVQIVHEFLQFGAGKMIGGIMGMALWRELAPMLTSVVVAGRVGAAISAELGTMRVTEQVEALEAMSQDPISYLVIPRFLACALMLPLLIGLADIVSFFSGFAIAVGTGRINPVAYLYSADRMLFIKDITGGLAKGVVFGMLIALISTYTGLSTSAGARGVGLSTTKAVVLSLVLIFVVNYFLSLVIFA